MGGALRIGAPSFFLFIMNYFISDLHFGHENVIAFENRPYASVGEMDDDIINKWNSRVKGCDTVYIVGDLIFENKDPEPYLSRLKGRKILIVGNHDEKWLKNYPHGVRYFEAVTDYLVTTVENRKITFCHYPMYEWKNSRKIGSKKAGYHVYGHIHGRRDDIYKPIFALPHSFNAGADINGLMPVPFDELVKNNEAFKLSALTSDMARARFLAASRYLFQSCGREPYIEYLDKAAEKCASETEKCAVYLRSMIEDRLIDGDTLRSWFSEETITLVYSR